MSERSVLSLLFPWNLFNYHHYIAKQFKSVQQQQQKAI